MSKDKPQKTREQQLISLARRGHVAPLLALVQAGSVNINFQDDEKNLKLWSDGALRGHDWKEIVPAKWNKPGTLGNTALMWALSLGRVRVAEALMAAGAKPSVRNLLNEEALHLVTDSTAHLIDAMVEKGAQVNGRNIWGATPLMMAAYLGHVKVAKKLLEHGALLSLKTPGGLDAKTLLQRNGNISLADVAEICALEDRANYVSLLKSHDWYYQYSDDHGAWRTGSSTSTRLSELQPELDPDYKIWNSYAPKEFRHEDKVLEGQLIAFSEQGSEGTRWAFQEKGKQGYDGLHILKDGDLLTVFNDVAGKKIWQGEVALDRDSNVHPLPMAPSLKRQWIKAVGAVHGVQKGVEPAVWAKMFLDEKPARLIVKPYKKRNNPE